MTTYQTSIVAGVFKSEMEARKAVDLLRNAQFERDQLGVAMHNGGASTESLSNDFINLGVPRDRANFYEHEFRAGKIVVSVRPDGREEEVRTILSSSGAYDYDAATPASQVATEAQSSDQPALDAQAVQPAEVAQAVQPPIEEDRPEHEVQPTEHSTVQEAADLNPSDDAERPINAPAEDSHDQPQINDSQAHVAEPEADSSSDAGHNPDNA